MLSKPEHRLFTLQYEDKLNFPSMFVSVFQHVSIQHSIAIIMD